MLNKVQLIGNLGKDPELRHTQNNTAVCSFSIATAERFKNKEDEWVDKTEWHNIVAWGKLAEICGQYLHKGKQVYVEGGIQTRKWEDQEGNSRYTTEIKINEMKMLGQKGDSQQNNVQEAYPEAPASKPDQDDDLPF